MGMLADWAASRMLVPSGTRSFLPSSSKVTIFPLSLP